MDIDGKQNVKERIKVFENDSYTTYFYVFENGNGYNDTVNTWNQSSFERRIKRMPFEQRLERKLAKGNII